MIKLTFNGNIEPEQKAELNGYLADLLWLMPGWVQTIHVNLWNSDNESGDATISIKVLYEYRSVSLDFYSCWLNQPKEAKLEQCIHELLHVHLSLIADYSRDKLNLLCPVSEAEKFNTALQDGLRERHESATQDLARVIYNKLYRHDYPA